MARRVPALPFLVAVVGLLVGCEPTPEPRATPLVHSAYVWKQGWTPAAAGGLAPEVIPTAITELNVLVGECGLSGGNRSVAVPWEAVRASGRAIAVSVRVGSHRTAKATPLDNLDQGLALARKGLAAAEAAGVDVREVQIDFDCPTRLLADYAAWIRKAKVGMGDVRLTVTALPTWVYDGDFEGLVAAADGWTLQVHGTEPANLEAPKPLIDGDRAVDWIKKANRLGRPYRVALPTYSYLACFNANGRYLGMRAEGGGLAQGTAKVVHLPADPGEVSKVLRSLQDGRNGLVQAVDWYRLPLPGDKQAWTAKGLGEVIAGREIGAEITFEARRQGPLIDIFVKNDTEQPLPLPTVRVSWKGAELVGADATLDWQAKPAVAAVVFERQEAAGFLPPRTRRAVGWVRLTEEGGTEVVEIKAGGR